MELGERAQISFSHVSRFERGLARPNPEALDRLAAALDVPVTELVVESEQSGGSDPEILQQLQEIENLPDEERQIVKRLLSAFLFQYRVKHLSTRL